MPSPTCRPGPIAARNRRPPTRAPDAFAPRVINLFEAARAEARAEQAPPKQTASTPAAKKKGSKTPVILIGVVAAAGAGVAAAAGGGGGSSPSPSQTTTPSTTRQTLTRSDVVVEQSFFNVTATKSGVMEVTVSWRNRDVRLDINCQMHAPPYTGCRCPRSGWYSSDST